VRRGTDATRIDWAHNSAWRFMPPVQDSLGGFLLHDVDLAVNKTLALAGRDDPHGLVDILYVHDRILPLAGLVWAAVGKDPGSSPLSLLGLLERRGRHRPEEIARLDLAAPFDLTGAKTKWLAALDDVDAFVRSQSEDEFGCLYYSVRRDAFVLPHPGGVLPQPAMRQIVAGQRAASTQECDITHTGSVSGVGTTPPSGHRTSGFADGPTRECITEVRWSHFALCF